MNMDSERNPRSFLHGQHVPSSAGLASELQIIDICLAGKIPRTAVGSFN